MQTTTLYLEKEFYAAYFGRAAEYYWKEVEKLANGFKLTFNIWAFLFTILWFAYRKMYLELIVSLAAFCIVNYFLQGRELYLFFLINFVLQMLIALTANQFYVAKG